MEIEELSKLPNTRKEAKDLDLSRYFTGKPCKHGHISSRQTSDGSCAECKLIDKARRRNVIKNDPVLKAEYKIKKSKIDSRNRQKIKNDPDLYDKKLEYQANYRNKIKNDPEMKAKQASDKNKWSIKNRAENPEKYTAKDAKRRAQKANATPLYVAKKFKEDESPEQEAKFRDIRKLMQDQIEAIYAEAKRLTKETNIKHHVDHIFALTPKDGDPQGLHVPWNLQILTQTKNTSKHNKLPNDPMSWHLHELNENRVQPDPKQDWIQD